MNERVFKLSRFLQPSEGEPIRSVVAQTSDASVVAWIVPPGQCMAPHVHPHGQDIWMLMSGQGDYQVDAPGRTVPIVAGDVVVAATGEVHRVRCTGDESLVLMSVVGPAEAGKRARTVAPTGSLGTLPQGRRARLAPDLRR